MTRFRRSVVSLLIQGSETLGVTLSRADISATLTRPPKPEMGDLAFPCFQLAPVLKRPPTAIATSLGAAIEGLLSETASVDRVQPAGPYLNFWANRERAALDVLGRAIGDRLRGSQLGVDETVVIDFSSPNVAKPFGIGHLRSTAIGAALGRIFRAQGYRVVGINHIGDWGTQFGKLISAWKRWGDAEQLTADPIGHLYDLYVKFHDLEPDDSDLAQEGRDWFKRLEDGDEEARALWERFRSESLREFKRIYRRMGVEFEHTWGEAFYEDKLAATVQRLQDSGVAERSEGALIVRVDDIYPGTSPCLILRSDGASLYTTRDITAAIYRYEQYEPARLLYVTGADQADHFRKVFGTLARMGLDWADRCEHVPFGRIHGISTRRGTLVFLEDVFDRARELSLEQMKDRNMSEDERLAEAEKIGVGAVVFFDLSKERIKDAEFDWEAILQIQGRTGPGLQYTVVRLKSLLAKYGEVYGDLPDPEEVEYERLEETEIAELVQLMGEYRRTVDKAAEAREPAILSRYLLDLADGFNSFYSGGTRIVGDDRDTSAARVTFCRALLEVLTAGLALLGVPAPDRM